MAKGLLVTLIRIFWHQDGTSGFWNGESISIFFPGKIITPQGYDTSFLLSAHGMAHGMTSSLEREHMSRRPGTVGQIVIQAPRIAVDVELQSGQSGQIPSV